MIATGDIRDAVNRLLVTQLHAQTVYINRCPKNFKRPSYWLETVRRETTDVNYTTIKVVVYFSITCFISLNGYGNSDSKELTNMQDTVAALFQGGRLAVKDRLLKVSANTAGYENDRSYVNLQFEFFDDRPVEAEDVPLMGDIDMTFEKR